MRILIVDDSPTFLRAASDIIEAEGYEVETARNGKEGVQFAKKVKPDLIIMDIEMPIMSGIKATQELREDPELAGVPVIAMTSNAPESLGDDIKLFDAHLTKPFGFNENNPSGEKFIEQERFF